MRKNQYFVSVDKLTHVSATACILMLIILWWMSNGIRWRWCHWRCTTTLFYPHWCSYSNIIRKPSSRMPNNWYPINHYGSLICTRTKSRRIFSCVFFLRFYFFLDLICLLLLMRSIFVRAVRVSLESIHKYFHQTEFHSGV